MICKKIHPYEWDIELFNFAQQLGITIFSHLDESAGDLLKSLHCPAFKIAFELTDLPLLKYIALKNLF